MKIDYKQTMSKATPNKSKGDWQASFMKMWVPTVMKSWLSCITKHTKLTAITWKLTKQVYTLFSQSMNIIFVAFCLINCLELINNRYPGYKH